jgi:hypothetical protein
LDFKKERVNGHNLFPESVEFKAEKKFKQFLNLNKGNIPFKTIDLGYGDDTEYQTYIGHYLDGLELLPFRPDFMFDHCFKIIDDAGRVYFPKKGVKGIVQGLGNLLINSSRKQWEEIADQLGQNIPLMTCRFIAKRICESHYCSNDTSEQYNERARECFGADFYQQFIKRFTWVDGKKNLSDEQINKASHFLKLYLSGKQGTKKTIVQSYKKLNLTKEANLPKPQQRLELILSLLLFLMRNERSHGVIISPFRTSRSSIDRYQSYYFAMLSAYIFSLGVLKLKGFGGMDDEVILNCCEDNLKIQKLFFNPTKKLNQ